MTQTNTPQANKSLPRLAVRPCPTVTQVGIEPKASEIGPRISCVDPGLAPVWTVPHELAFSKELPLSHIVDDLLGGF
jgi:hypothetical protein